jgi:hypothetical protein
MFFDFRRGADRWPANVELVSPEAAEALIQKKRDAAAKEAPGKKVDTTRYASLFFCSFTRQLNGMTR